MTSGLQFPPKLVQVRLIIDKYALGVPNAHPCVITYCEIGTVADIVKFAFERVVTAPAANAELGKVAVARVLGDGNTGRLGPVAPVQPVQPVLPDGPCTPCTPCSPVGPVGPVGPWGPTNPAHP